MPVSRKRANIKGKAPNKVSNRRIRQRRDNESPRAIYAACTQHKSVHGQCSPWLRENRRRRAAGMPQMRIIKLTGDIWDPMKRRVIHTHRDGIVEIQHLPA